MRTYKAPSLDPIWFLIAANILIFIVTWARSEAFSFLGLEPANFWHQPWTIITNLFVHGSIGHIIANMVSLYFLGSFFIRLVGDRNFLRVYFIGGIIGNIFYLFLGEPFSIVVGASGAIFAIGGALALMRPNIKVLVFPIPAPLPLWVAIIGGFLIISFFPHVAWQAHLGGLLSGLLAGYYFKKRRIYF